MNQQAAEAVAREKANLSAQLDRLTSELKEHHELSLKSEQQRLRDLAASEISQIKSQHFSERKKLETEFQRVRRDFAQMEEARLIQQLEDSEIAIRVKN